MVRLKQRESKSYISTLIEGYGEPLKVSYLRKVLLPLDLREPALSSRGLQGAWTSPPATLQDARRADRQGKRGDEPRGRKP
jgi:hypothetical protein